MARIVMQGHPMTIEERNELQAKEIRAKEQQIEAQQQEIDRLKDENASIRKWNVCEKEQYEQLLESDKRRIELEERIEALTADKDAQAGTIMRMVEALEEATEDIENLYGHDTPQTERYRALLGGKEDVD